MAPFAPLGEEPRPGLLGFADKDDIDETREVGLVHGSPWTADDRKDATAFELTEDFLQPLALHVHARHTDDVGARAAGKIDRLDILVDEGDVVPGWGQRC